MRNKEQGRTDASRFRASPDTVYNRIEDQGVLIHMRTNRIFELNRTGARFWELLQANHSLVEIRQLMLEEFDVAEADLIAETEAMLASFRDEGLITEAN